MTQFSYIIQDPVGLHARPASKLVKFLTQFASTVHLKVGDKTANAKSIINLMSLGLKFQSSLIFCIEGSDEQEVVSQLPKFFEENKI